jgi:hypothetical protein
MKRTIFAVIGIALISFMGCQSEKEETTLSKKSKSWHVRENPPKSIFTPILTIEVDAVAVLPDGKEVVVKKFQTPPNKTIKGNAYVHLSDSSEVDLELPIKCVAHVTFFAGDSVATMTLPYLMQKKGDLIDPVCGNHIAIAKR